jgi:REP element-mobilizing transposase RayT
MVKGGYNIEDQYSLYFLTFTVVGWIDIFTRKECKDIVIDSLKYCIKNKGLVINAYVLMESHLHLVARAEEDSVGLSNIIRDFKKYTSRQITEWILNSGKESRRDWIKTVLEYHAKFNNNNSKYQFWQQHNQPKECVLPRFTWQKIDYIHDNPVRKKIVDHPEDYIYSSARNYLFRKDIALNVECLEQDSGIGFIET